MENKYVVCWLVGLSSRRDFSFRSLLGRLRLRSFARPWRQAGIPAPRNADEVPVKFEDKYVPAELCLPGQRSRGAIGLRAMLDSGAHFTSVSLPIVEMMLRTFSGVKMRVPFSLGGRQAVTASGQKVSITERTIPLQLALVTPGSVLGPSVSAAHSTRPTDCPISIQCSAFRRCGFGTYTSMGLFARLRQQKSAKSSIC